VDPVSASLPHLPALAQQRNDLAAVLARSRFVAAEVVQRLDGGSVVLGLAGRKIAAVSQVELEAGDHLLLEAEGGAQDGAPVLRLVQRLARADAALRQAFLSARLSAEPGSVLLRDLTARLSANLERMPPDARATAAILLGRLQGLDWRAGDDGARLAHAWRSFAARPEALLARAVEGRVEGRLAHALAAEVAEALIEGLQVHDASVAARLRAGVLRLCSAPVDAARAAEVLGGLRELVRALLRVPLDEARLAKLGGGALLALLGDPAGREDLARVAARLASDTPASWLAAALEGLEDEPTRALVGQALDALDGEALVEVARRREGAEQGSWSPSCGDSPRWLKLREERRESKGAAEVESRRLVVDLGFERLGAVRADLRGTPAGLQVRLACADAAAARELGARLEWLAARLALDGRAPRVVVAHEADLGLAGARAAEEGTGGAVLDVSA
jgi:hypothetical protein